MKQFARDPRARSEMAEVFRQRDELLRRAPLMSDDEISDLVQQLFSAKDNLQGTLSQVLESVGTRAEAPLLRALDDPRCDPTEESADWRHRPGFETVVRLLSRLGSADALPRMVGLMRNGTVQPRKMAALCVASIGSEAAISPTIAAISDPEEYVRLNAMQGVFEALASNRATDGFRNAVFDSIAHIASGTSKFNAFGDRDAAALLLKLDWDRAIGLLRSGSFVRWDNPQLTSVLKALNIAGAPLDGKVIAELLNQCERTTNYPSQYVREECVRMLLRVDPEFAAAELEKSLLSGEKSRRDSAARLLREREGLDEAEKLSFGIDLRSLPKPVGVVLLAWKFQAEVNNGGISQFFFNPSGDRWPQTIEALRAIGATSCVQILESAAAVFGSKGPDTNRERRIKQYAAVSDDREETLDQLSGQFYKDEDQLDVLVTRYMIQHADDFRTAIRQHVRTPERAAS